MRPTVINGVRGVGFLSDKGAYGVYNLVPSPRHQQIHAKALQTIRFVVLITLEATPSSLQQFECFPKSSVDVADQSRLHEPDELDRPSGGLSR